MKWRICFCDDVKSGANLWDRNFPHAAVPVNYTIEFRKLVEATTYIQYKNVRSSSTKYFQIFHEVWTGTIDFYHSGISSSRTVSKRFVPLGSKRLSRVSNFSI
jgi:hypothetical protein